MQLTEEEIVADYEEIMRQYQADDEWDLPAALFIRWDDSELRGAIVVIPTEDPKVFLQMLLDGGVEMAQAVFRGIGEVPEDTKVASIALINEGWGIHPDSASKEEIIAVETGASRISDLPSRVEVRLCFVVTKNKGVYFGCQNKGGDFEWISRSDNPDGGSAAGILPFMIYPLVTGEPYKEPEGLDEVRKLLGVEEVNDLRFRNAPDQ